MMKTLKYFLILCGSSLLAQDIVIDSSGTQGRVGSRGSDGRNGLGYGSDGGHAGDGGDGQPGTSAVGQELRIRSTDNGFVIEGQVGGASVQKAANPKTGIILRAEGGDGGDAGRGGDGGNGASGSPGRPGTRSSGGGDGGRGGDGGNGGRGGDGGASGSGAAIVLEVSEADLYLLSLLDEKPRTGAGRPGVGGDGGSSGSGGSGGPGGRGESWTTTRTVPRTETVSESVRNSDGTTSYQTRTKNYTETVTDYHSTPSGSLGPSGRSGFSGSRGNDGRVGSDGSFVFRLNGSQVFSFERRYNLSLKPYELRDSNNDGIWEPGEKAELIGVVVHNTGGGMPTPPPGAVNARTQIFLKPQPWLLPLNELTLDQSLANTESKSFADPLRFSIKEAAGPSINQPRLEKTLVEPDALLLPTERHYSHFDAPTPLDVQYPVQLKLIAPPALAQGEKGRVKLIVTNISTQAIGFDTTTKRPVRLKVQTTDPEAKAMTYINSAAQPTDLIQGANENVMQLAAGESKVIEGVVVVDPDHPPYSQYPMKMSLELGTLGGDQEKIIQEEMHQVSVAIKYATDPNNDIILVCNHMNSAQEIAEWKDMLELDLGLQTVVWNHSYYGNFDLLHELIETPRWNLAEDFAGKVVIVLNNEHTSYAGQRQVRSSQALSKRAFITSTYHHKTRFLFVGKETETSRKTVAQWLKWTPQETDPRIAVDSEADVFLKLHEIHAERTSAAERPWNTVVSWDVTRSQWSQPTEEQLKALADKLRAKLELLWPARRFVVATDFSPEIAADRWLWRDRFRLGRINIYRLFDLQENTISFVDDAASSPQKAVSGLIDVMPFAEKVGMMERFAARLKLEQTELNRSLFKQTVASVTADLVQEVWLSQRETVQDLHPRRLLHQFVDHRWDPTIATHPEVKQLIVQLYTRVLMVSYYGYSNLAWRSSSLPRKRYHETYRYLHPWVLQFLSEDESSAVMNASWVEHLGLIESAGWSGWFSSWNATKVERLMQQVIQRDEALQRAVDVGPEDLDDVPSVSAEDWRKRTIDDLKAREEADPASK